MKLNKKILLFILIFLGINFLGILSLKFIGHRGIGNLTSTGPLSWDEIYKNLPWGSFISAIFSAYLVVLIDRIKKDVEKNVEKEKKRKEDAEKSHSQPYTHECRVCGHFSEEYPWGEDGKSPTLELCPCCGVQFGVDDDTIDIVKVYRAKWINEGAKWLIKDQKPEQWNIEEQLQDIPEKFK